MRGAAAGAVLLLAACAPPLASGTRFASGSARPSAVSTPMVKEGVSRAPSASEAAEIRSLMRETERLRGLPFRAPVEVRIEDRAAMRAYVTRALDDEDLATARRRYVALGLLDPAIDVRELVESLMEEELIGYYDPKHKRLALRDEVASALVSGLQPPHTLEWRATVVHELVHALQDQHLGLSEAMDLTRTTDQENAYAALVEGDATLTMLGYMAKSQGVSLEALVADQSGLVDSLRGSDAPQRDSKLAQAPAIVREPLLFRYRDGALFVARLFAEGGFRRVDEAHRAPPSATLTVREPLRYLQRTDEPTIDLPPLSFLGQYACTEVERDVLGALELAAAFAKTATQRAQLASGWRGDRYALLSCAGHDAAVWFMRFASIQTAQRAKEAIGRHAEGASGRHLLVAHGTHLLVARELSSDAARELTVTFQRWATLH